MKKNLRTHAVLAGVSLAANALFTLAGASTALATDTAVQPVTNAGPSATDVNRASLAAIEESFLQVPKICKARSAAFDPVQVGAERASAEMTAVASIHGMLQTA